MLRLSEGFESDRRNALAAALAELARAEDMREATIGELDKQRTSRFELLSRGTDITIIINNYQREVALTLRIDAQGDVIAEHEMTVEKRRDELTERMRERKTYDKLRKRALDQHNIEMKREENRVIDDVASIAFGRTQADEHGKD